MDGPSPFPPPPPIKKRLPPGSPFLLVDVVRMRGRVAGSQIGRTADLDAQSAPAGRELWMVLVHFRRRHQIEMAPSAGLFDKVSTRPGEVQGADVARLEFLESGASEILHLNLGLMSGKRIAHLILALHIRALPFRPGSIGLGVLQIINERHSGLSPLDILIVKLAILVDVLNLRIKFPDVMPRVRQDSANWLALFKVYFVSRPGEHPIHRERKRCPIRFNQALEGCDSILRTVGRPFDPKVMGPGGAEQITKRKREDAMAEV